MKPFALSSNRVCTPEGVRQAAVVIDGEQIVAIDSCDSRARDVDVRDLGDLIVSPGIIDTHVHVNDPGTNWEGFQSATRAAAAGGITTIVDMPLNSIPVTTTLEALQQKRGAAEGKCCVDVGFYGGLVPGNLDQVPGLIDAGVLGIKAFLCHSGLEEFPNVDESDLRAVLPMLKSADLALLVHAESVDERSNLSINDPRTYEEYLNSRPDDWELNAIELMIDLCREFETRIHIVHLATAKAISRIVAAKNEGLPITVETCPHYLYFAAERIPDGATPLKCAPPIRREQNRVALCQALTSGTIDSIGSDHSPCPVALKNLKHGDFGDAWGGIAGLQLSLPVVWTVGQEFGWRPEQLSQWLSRRPAQLVGLEKQKGCLAVGFDADVVVWDPDATFHVDQHKLFHRHACSPYHGEELRGMVRQTYVRGQLAFGEGQHLPANGKLLFRRRSNESTVAGCLNRMDQQEAFNALEKCCAAIHWIEQMIADRPFIDDQDMALAAENYWNGLNRESRLKAFAAHPRIGDVDSLRKRFANTESWAADEQAGVDQANEGVIARLAQLNDVYFDKFGYIFIVCATGKTAAEMLNVLESRLANDVTAELQIASDEQLKITLLRLGKLTQDD